MKITNPHRNNELVALIEVLKEKNIITEQEIKTKKQQIKK